MGMMNDFDDLDDLEFEEFDSDETVASGASSNRTFLIVAGILGGILLLALIAIAAYAVVILPGRDTNQQTQVAAINATNTAIAEQSQQTAIAKQATLTPTNTATLPPTETPLPTATTTNTPVVAPTNTPVSESPTPDPATQTVAALLTQQAGGEESTPIATATALPDTGFGDDFGAPTQLLLAAVLVAVIILSRRLRSAPN